MPRHSQEGLRLGTVRHPPRGVSKAEFAARDFYDVRLPNLAPTEALLKAGQSAGDARSWAAFKRGADIAQRRFRHGPGGRPRRVAATADRKACFPAAIPIVG
ncbi:MAG: hypothetical protein ABI569_02170 [Casimicrobiaceae bacterium]